MMSEKLPNVKQSGQIADQSGPFYQVDQIEIDLAVAEVAAAAGPGLSTPHISPHPPNVIIDPGSAEVLPFFTVVKRQAHIVHVSGNRELPPLVEIREVPVPVEHQSLSSHSDAFAEVYVDGTYVKVKPQLYKVLGGPSTGGGQRGKAQYSPASRHRLLEKLAKTDRAYLPLFVTLTYPNIFPDDPVRWKRDMDTFGKRFRRAFPKAAFVWRMEVVPRKSGSMEGELAPHFHLLLWGVPYSSLAPVVDTVKGERLVIRHGWLSVAWWQVVNLRYDLRPSLPLLPGLPGSALLLLLAILPNIAHLRAGTSVEWIRSWNGVMFYAAKYLAKVNFAHPGDVGRWWGIIGRKNMPWSAVVVISLTDLQATKAIRVGRKMIGLVGRSLRYGLSWFMRGDRFLDYLEFLEV